MNVRQFVAVNEYGACLTDTLSDTPEAAESKFCDSCSKVYGADATLEGLACCIVRLDPVVVMGKPHGYWAKPDPLCEYDKELRAAADALLWVVDGTACSCDAGVALVREQVIPALHRITAFLMANTERRIPTTPPS